MSIRTKNINSMNNGKIMQTKEVVAFKFLGNYYTTNKRRNKIYSMDYNNWQVLDIKYPAIYKLYRLLKGDMKKLH